MTTVIDRPVVDFDAVAHRYRLDTGEDLAGVSSVAKIGGAEDTWGIASAWGFRIGYEGAFDVAADLVPADEWPGAKDDLREILRQRGLTPWSKRDKAAERGTWVHDVLESLGQDGEVADLAKFPDEVRGHVQSLYRWFLAFRPEFVALEVQVASRQYGFAGRYDVRAKVSAKRLLPCLDKVRTDAQAERIRELAAADELALGVLDLKTSKGIYPTTHFPQLEGYEGGGVEMGFPASDFRAVINTHEDGTFDPATDFGVSWSTYEDFLGLLEAFRAIKRIKNGDPELVRQRAAERVLLENLPSRSRELAGLGLPELEGMDSRAIGRMLGKMGKRGAVVKEGAGVWAKAD